MKIAMHPGEFLNELYIKPYNLDIKELARALRVAQSDLHLLINQRADLSVGMAIRLSMVIGRSPESWLNLQQNYAINEYKSSHEKVLSELRRMHFPCSFDGGPE